MIAPRGNWDSVNGTSGYLLVRSALEERGVSAKIESELDIFL